MIKETDLYPPIKSYFQNLGYEVKAEVNHCDVVAKRNDEPLVIVELKTRANLELILQASERLSLSDEVYIAFPSTSPTWKRNWRRIRTLCRRLGVGIITLEGKPLRARLRLEPGPYRPRGRKIRQKRLQAEFNKRIGDNNIAGSNQKKIMTAYKQDALRCLAVFGKGPLPLAEIRALSGVWRANTILQKNHYAWFDRVNRGNYRLSKLGRKALNEYSDLIEQIVLSDKSKYEK